MMTPFPPKTPMQMGLLKQRPPQHSSPPLTPEQKRQVEAARVRPSAATTISTKSKRPPPTGSRTSRLAALRRAESAPSPRTFANIRCRLGAH